MSDKIFEIVNDNKWEPATLVLYVLIILMSFLISTFETNKCIIVNLRDKKRTIIDDVNTLLIFLILFSVSAIRDTGIDLEVYKEIFNSVNSKSSIEYYGIEKGFVLINKIIRIFTESDAIAIAIFSFVTIYLFLNTINYYRDKLVFSLAVTAYVCMFYFQSFSLVRIYLVSSIIFYNFRLLEDNKLLKYFFLIIGCFFIHASSLTLLLPLAFLKIYKNNPKYFFIAYFTCFICIYTIANQLQIFNFSARYSDYFANNEATSIGVLQFVYYAPLFYLLYIAKVNKYNENLFSIFLVFTLSSFMFSILSYKLTVMGRLSIYYTYPFLLFMPMLIKFGKENGIRFSNYWTVFYILYLFFRFTMYFLEYAYTDGIMPYKTLLWE